MVDKDKAKDVVHKNWLLWKLMKHFNFQAARIDVVEYFPRTYSISLGRENHDRRGWPLMYGRIMDIDDNGKLHCMKTDDARFLSFAVQEKLDAGAKKTKVFGKFSFFPVACSNDLLHSKAALFDILASMKNGFGWKTDKHLNSFGAIEQLVMKFELEATAQDVRLEDSMLSYIDLLDSLHHPLPF